MGTSKSSPGSPGGVPMVPPWTPEAASPGPESPANAADPAANEPSNPRNVPAPNPVVPIAPAGRFGSARTSLGKFASSGSARDMRRGMGHYARTGLGGAATAARRMGGTARSAGSLYQSLSNFASGSTAAGGQLDPNVLRGRSASEIAMAIVDAIRPTDGTLDSDASRNAMQDSFSQLLAQFPEADLLNLTDDQRWLVVEGYLAADIFNRISLDVGKAIQDKAPSAVVALQRLKDVKAFVRATVGARLAKLHTKGAAVTGKQVSEIIRRTIRETFEVFESYAT